MELRRSEADEARRKLNTLERDRDRLDQQVNQSFFSVVDPEPYVFGHPGSGSVIQRYGSGSDHHQAKIVRTVIPTVF